MKHFYFFLCLTGSLLLPGFTAKSQSACDNSAAFVNNICLQSSVAVGTQTKLGETFTWYKDGVRKRGPLSGNGGAISYDFAVNNSVDAGIYTIERSVEGQETTCANKIQVVIVPLPQAQTLSGGGYMCSGFKTLRLANSQASVRYEFLRYNQYTFDVYGTGGAMEVQVYQEGVYSVRASFDGACSQSYLYFGNETVTQQPELVKVIDFGTTTATLNWPGAGSHIIEYGLSGFTPGTSAAPGVGGTVVNTTLSQTLLTGLTPGKGYDVYVRVPCEDGSYSSNMLSIFATGCSGQTVYPITENFETVTIPALPSCWTMLDVDQDTQLNFSVGPFGANGTNGIQLPLTGDMLVMPALSLSGNKRLRFKIRSTSYYPEVFQVKLSGSSNTPAAFNTVLMSDTLSSGSYVEKIINLSGYSGTVYISIAGLKAIYPSGSYFFNLDEVVIENTPACAGAGNVKADLASTNSIALSWLGSGSFIVEYGAPGFTPGTGAAAGVGGTVVNSGNNFLTLTGLTAATTYDVYVRQNCTAAGNGFSSNSSKLTVTTFLNCASAINISSACTSTTANVTAGPGLFSFNGFYPNNSCGTPTAGKELLYTFTPSVSGVYFLEITSASSLAYVRHFYKPASAGCNNKSWIGIHSSVYGLGRFPIGNLTAATTYYFLFDNEFEHAYTQTFKICRADVGTPSYCNSLTLRNTVPANSLKKEYLLDLNGALVAELDFAQVTSQARFNFSNIALNTGSVRRDFANKEYLDRSFSISTLDSLKGNLGVKFFFENAELTRLVDEPNDGNADVSGIADLNVSVFGQNECGGFVGVGTSIAQAANAVYDGNSSSLSFSHPVNGTALTYLFHGGLSPLTSDTSLPSVASICPGGSTSFTMKEPGMGYSYQWQVNDGSGFANVTNGEVYTGSQSNNLQITQPPTSFYGYKFRCLASNGGNSVYSSEKVIRFSMRWTGSQNEEWLHPNNWSCSSATYRIPDANTDVIIPSGYFSNHPTISNTVSCRSIVLQDGAIINMGPDGKLNVTGK